MSECSSPAVIDAPRTTPAQPMLTADGITIARDGRRLLDAVNCQVRAGELLVVLWPNGAGKSTLLRVLAGELHPDAGRVRLAGRTLAGWPARALAQQRAVLQQQSMLGFPFLVEEVVAILHDLNLALAYADRLLVLAGGRVLADGEPALVADAGHLSAAFSLPIEVIAHPRRTGRRLALAATACVPGRPITGVAGDASCHTSHRHCRPADPGPLIPQR